MQGRLMQLREALNMTAPKFAESIGYSRGFWNLVEKGERKISNRTIDDIVNVYGVNKEWLVSGTGEMFSPLTVEDELAQFAGELMKLPESSIQRRIIHGLTKLDESDWEDIARIVEKLTEVQNN